MKITDYSFYKKNVLLRHMMSKELDKHRAALKQEKSKKINDFVIPIFSGVLSLSITYYSKDFKLENLRYVGTTLLAYLLLYFIIAKLLLPCFKWLLEWIRNSFKSIDVNDLKSEDDILNIVNDFNCDVINQIYLSYSLITDNEDLDLNLQKYYNLESFFYFDKALGLLKDVFNEKTMQKLFNENISHIQTYRIENAFDLLKKIFDIIDASETSDRLKKDLINSRATYNNLAQVLLTHLAKYDHMFEIEFIQPS